MQTATLFSRAFLAGGLSVIMSAQDTGKTTEFDSAFRQLVPASARIEKLAGGMQFTEGPVWLREGGGYLLFSDIPANTIFKWTPGSAAPVVFRKPVFNGNHAPGQFIGSNGLTLDKQGRLVSCEHGNRRVARTEGGQVVTLADRFEGKRLNSPNDAVFKSNGDLYFSDPPYGFVKLDDDPAKELKFNGLYRLTPSGRLDLLVRDMTRPNGLAFSPDEKHLYVANSDEAKKIWMVFDVKPDGSVGAGRVFADVTSEKAPGLPDGMKVDKKGNIFATGPGGIWVFSPQGKRLGLIAPPEVPANCTWGDADGKALYMTARTGLYRIKLNTEGIRP